MAASTCKGCGIELDWDQSSGRWVAYEAGTSTRHMCPNYKKGQAQEAQPAPQPLREITPAVVADPYDLIQALGRLTAEVKELRRVMEEKLGAPTGP